MTDETITYRRAELYEEVWKEPVRTVARRYGVSDVALRNTCRKLRVPLPGRGHWVRIGGGREVRRPPLPPLFAGARGEIVAQKWTRRSTPPKVENLGPPIVVPAELHSPHKLVSEASRLLRGREPREGLVSCWGTRCLDIAVSPASLGRALRIINALIRALEEKGLQVEVTRPLNDDERRRGENEAPSNDTRVKVSGEWIQFGITEKRSVIHPPAPDPPKRLRGAELESWIRWNPPRRELAPNGVLELSITNGASGMRAHWHDGQRQRLEGCLADFIAHLQPMADEIKKHREEMLQRHREYEELQRRRLEEAQRRREEEERVRRFEEMLGRWRLARDAREYVAEVREIIVAANGTVGRDTQLEESLRWAQAFAERVDPVTRIREGLPCACPDHVATGVENVARELGEDAP